MLEVRCIHSFFWSWIRPSRLPCSCAIFIEFLRSLLRVWSSPVDGVSIVLRACEVSRFCWRFSRTQYPVCLGTSISLRGMSVCLKPLSCSYVSHCSLMVFSHSRCFCSYSKRCVWNSERISVQLWVPHSGLLSREYDRAGNNCVRSILYYDFVNCCFNDLQLRSRNFNRCDRLTNEYSRAILSSRSSLKVLKPDPLRLMFDFNPSSFFGRHFYQTTDSHRVS